MDIVDGRMGNSDMHLETTTKVIFLAGLVYILMTECKLCFSLFDVEMPCLEIDNVIKIH